MESRSRSPLATGVPFHSGSFAVGGRHAPGGLLGESAIARCLESLPVLCTFGEVSFSKPVAIDFIEHQMQIVIVLGLQVLGIDVAGHVFSVTLTQEESVESNEVKATGLSPRWSNHLRQREPDKPSEKGAG